MKKPKKKMANTLSKRLKQPQNQLLLVLPNAEFRAGRTG